MQSTYRQPTFSPLAPRTIPNPLAPKPVGAGALTLGSAVMIGYALAIGGGVGGGLLGAKYGGKHQKGATIVGTLLGAVVLPMIAAPIFMAAAAPAVAVTTPPPPPVPPAGA